MVARTSQDDHTRSRYPTISGRGRIDVQGMAFDIVQWDEAVSQLEAWADKRESRCVVVGNASSVITAHHDTAFQAAVRDADLVTADGMSVTWMLRRLGNPDQQRINGPDLMMRYCERAAETGHKIFLYGNTPETLAKLEKRLRDKLPRLQIVGSISPPFRPQTPAEDAADTAVINASGAQMIFVSLGCPKQEKWMADHVGRVQGVMIGLGAAFDYHAGTIRRAPVWMQNAGLEWLFRLCAEPRRLWRRYLFTNTAFIVGAARQLYAYGNEKSNDGPPTDHRAGQSEPFIKSDKR